MRIPKYLLIEQELKDEIESGKFEYGDRFHSEAELLARYDVSSITVVRALRDLVSMGYLVRKQGKGTFVSRSRKRQLVELTDIETFAGHLDRESVRVVSAKPGNDPAVRERLGLEPGEGYHDILRVRYVDETPFLVSHSHIPSRYIKDDTAPDYYDSIYRRLREDFGLHLYEEHATETDEVTFPTPPEPAALLGIDEQGRGLPAQAHHARLGTRGGGRHRLQALGVLQDRVRDARQGGGTQRSDGAHITAAHACARPHRCPRRRGAPQDAPSASASCGRAA